MWLLYLGYVCALVCVYVYVLWAECALVCIWVWHLLLCVYMLCTRVLPAYIHCGICVCDLALFSMSSGFTYVVLYVMLSVLRYMCVVFSVCLFVYQHIDQTTTHTHNIHTHALKQLNKPMYTYTHMKDTKHTYTQDIHITMNTTMHNNQTRQSTHTSNHTQ